jgi:putative ABC transport system ATP-binding protein
LEWAAIFSPLPFFCYQLVVLDMNTAHSLQLQGVAHSMIDAGTIKPILAQLNRKFMPGRLSVVRGPSGAGKTTLLSILSLTVQASRGMIHYGNDNLTALKPAKQLECRRRNIGMIFQTSRLIKLMNVSEHIQLASATRGCITAIQRGHELLSELGLGDKLTHRPEQLSGGEKQRVAIAQALCFNPRILLADEPTAALDQANAELVAQTLRAYAQATQAIVVCVSHDRAIIDAADDLLLLEKP